VVSEKCIKQNEQEEEESTIGILRIVNEKDGMKKKTTKLLL
jgi:hypothetical protein